VFNVSFLSNKEELEQGENKEKERQLVESIGFRHVIDCIVESKKVVIGHHCIPGKLIHYVLEFNMCGNLCNDLDLGFCRFSSYRQELFQTSPFQCWGIFIHAD
jgi:hypothetical protein